MCYQQIKLFAVSKDDRDTKKDTGKSIRNALYVLQYAKKHHLVRSDVVQWKNQAHSLSRYRVMHVWRDQSLSYSVTHSVENYFFFFWFRSNLLVAFQVDLKTCLGSVLPNQYCLIVVREKWGWFLGYVFHGTCLHLCDPYYTVLFYCIIVLVEIPLREEMYKTIVKVGMHVSHIHTVHNGIINIIILPNHRTFRGSSLCMCVAYFNCMISIWNFKWVSIVVIQNQQTVTYTRAQ